MAFEAETDLLQRAASAGMLDSAKGQAALVVYKQLREMGAKFSFGEFLVERRLLTNLAWTALQHSPGGAVCAVHTVADFQLLDLIGEGQSGAVFRALQKSLQRPVALKILNTTIAADAAALARFQNEAHATARLNHPNVVHSIDVGLDQGLHYFAMEYVEGGSLRALLRSAGGRLDEALALDLMRQAADGLHAAHTAGLVHGDVKPDNILLAGPPIPPPAAAPAARPLPAPAAQARPAQSHPARPFVARASLPPAGKPPAPHSATAPQPAAGLTPGPWQAKLADLGISKHFAAVPLPGAPAAAGGEFWATPEYAAPELIRGTTENDPRSDLYSLGATLFELLIGRPPYAGATPRQTLQMHLNAPLPDAQALRPDLHPRTVALLRSLLAKDPVQRPRSAAEVSAVLQALLQALRAPAPRKAAPLQNHARGRSYLLRKRLNG